MAEYLTPLLLLLLVAAVVYLILRMRTNATPPDASASLLMQQLDGIRVELRDSMQSTTQSLNQRLDATTQTVNQQLTIVTNQLGSVTQQLQTNTGQMGSRLDNAARVIQDVQGQLGELGKATQEIKELGQNVSSLNEMLRAPKYRGGLGEALLEDMLRQVLPAGSYESQYKFRNGQAVDAVIRTAGGLVPIDSKFPLENFRKFVEAKTDQERSGHARTFRNDVKKHIDAIHDKYIVPDEGTFDFALMYIPAENIYYETIIKDERFPDADSLHTYAVERHVIPVSPNSLYAHLQVIALGLKGLQIERSARTIIEQLARLGTELQKFSDVFDTLGGQLNNAKNNFDRADKMFGGLVERFRSVQSLPDSPEGPSLELKP